MTVGGQLEGTRKCISGGSDCSSAVASSRLKAQQPLIWRFSSAQVCGCRCVYWALLVLRRPVQADVADSQVSLPGPASRGECCSFSLSPSSEPSDWKECVSLAQPCPWRILPGPAPHQRTLVYRRQHTQLRCLLI
ncbi:hypothetical protein NDU88_005145 [Pleurodeles waltl]|uniref:Uncharacterized protein n=1 Tax=Pleurodeles waltl TaxID=8319 RepID=A0AAV7LKA5_PLEWA|nr:hypothetical protein NDU88_005145 [Pleurodeles waltl]